MDRFTSMRVFRRVVELESFSAAARDLGISNAAVSKHVSDLEGRLETQLLNRTTRRMSVTETGRAFYERCVRILDDLEEAERAVSHLHSTPRGILKINAPNTFGILHLQPIMPDFMQRYPELIVELTLNDRFVDIVEEGVDVAVRGGGPLTDSTLIARRVAPIRRILCASPNYVDGHGTPTRPADLAKHNCLIYSLSSSPRDWTFQGPDGPQTVRVTGNYVANNSLAHRDALLADMGVAMVPSFIVGEDIRAGRLRCLMKDYPVAPHAMHAVYPQNRHLSAKVRVFVDFLVERFAPEPPWDPPELCQTAKSA